MNHLGLVGIDWRAGGPELLAKFTVPPEQRPDLVRRMQRELPAREVVYLATCNRVEVAFVTAPGQSVAACRARIFEHLRGREPRPDELHSQLRAWGGEGAAEHLFRLAAGLESAVIGEREIVGQMRQALALAQEAGTAGRILPWLFEQAWAVGRRVHASTELGSGKVSIAEVALARLGQHLGPHEGTVALVGVSPMTLRCARGLAKEDVPFRFYNRTPERAVQAAAEVGGSGHALRELLEDPPSDIVAVVSATSAPEPIFGRPELEKIIARQAHHAPVLVDLATPPDIDPQAAKLVGLQRIGMQEILEEVEAHRQARAQKGHAAAIIVEQALEGLDAKLADEVVAPVLAALQTKYRDTAVAGVQRLLRKDLHDLTPEQQERVHRWAEVLARRFAHIPTLGLRAVARSHGMEAIESFVAGADATLHEQFLQGGRSTRHELVPEDERFQASAARRNEP